MFKFTLTKGVVKSTLLVIMFPVSPFTKTTTFHGQKLTLSSGLLALQATSSVTATIGETTVMCNVVVGKSGYASDYFPLQVIYEERMYASGKIKGSRFMKREGRPTDQAVLTGRMVDRSVRSLFNPDLRNEIQVIITVLSLDEVNPPDTLAVIAASTALSLCGLGDEFKGPVSSVRVGTKSTNIKAKLVQKLVKDIQNTKEYNDIAHKIETVSQILEIKNASDKALLKKIYDAMKAKNEDWKEKFRQVYEASIRLDEIKITKALGIDNTIVINPTYTQQEVLDLDLVISGNGKNIMMVEAGANIIDEDTIGKCFDAANEELEVLTKFQQLFINEVMSGKSVTTPELVTSTVEEKYYTYWRKFNAGLTKAMYATGNKKDKEAILSTYSKTHTDNLKDLGELIATGKIQSLEQFRSLPAKLKSEITKVTMTDKELTLHKDITSMQVELFTGLQDDIKQHTSNLYTSLYKVVSEIMKKNILDHGKRVDGRALQETRQITCAVDTLPRTHGSSLFQRGETQVLNILTIGTQRDAQILDGMEDFEEQTKRYIHHYNFPSYSVGETGRYGPPSRREIGHGSLAEKALLPVLPSLEEFPYTMLLVSECLGSNGSTSMASTCGSCLSLMSGGVPLLDMVAGVAMGLMLDSASGKFKVLTDIQGLEDHHGDMDFKVTGTKNGITAIQLDNKVAGLTPEILKLALKEALAARLHILGIMEQTIAKPHPEMSPYAPRVAVVQVPFDKIGDVIGPSGKIIKGIIAKTQTEIELVDETGQTFVYGRDAAKVTEAVSIIEGLIKEYTIGDKVSGKVFRIEPFGAFIKIDGSGKEAMIHVSELAHTRTEKVEDVVNLGDQLNVQIVEIKPNGQLGGSLKSLQPKPEKPPIKERPIHKKSTYDKPSDEVRTRFQNPPKPRENRFLEDPDQDITIMSIEDLDDEANPIILS
jgi:polyribonucleotide nucleotidyltransferase